MVVVGGGRLGGGGGGGGTVRYPLGADARFLLGDMMAGMLLEEPTC